jgi:lysophospholipase L1-like esterase
MANLGKVVITPKGTYSATVNYLKLDSVLYQGSSWIALQPSTGVIPVEGAYWTLMAQGYSTETVTGIVTGITGDKSQLETESKANLVGAINEVNRSFENPINNKKLAFCGDSICFGYGWNVEDGTWVPKGWSYIIKENNPSCDVHNISAASATLTNALADNNILIQVESLITNKSTYTPDYIFLQGGINDRNAGAQMGKAGTSFTPTNDSAYLATVSGAVDYMLYRLITNFPNARIGFISSTRCTGNDYQPILDAINKVCNKWSIPVLDLWNNGELNPNVSSINTQYFYQADGVHPKEIGYRRFIAPKVEKWIKTEMIGNKMIVGNWVTVGTGDKSNSYTINTNLDRFTEIYVVISTPDHYYNNYTKVIPTCAIFSYGRYENLGDANAKIQLNLSLSQISMSVCTIEGVSYLDNAYTTSITVYAK